jgi:hypothetical protein
VGKEGWHVNVYASRRNDILVLVILRLAALTSDLGPETKGKVLSAEVRKLVEVP